MSTLSPRREAFCRYYAVTLNATRAAMAAGYRPRAASDTGSRLLKLPEVKERIADLRREAVQAECLHRDALLAKLEATFRQAIDNQSYVAAVRAIQLQARLAGLLVPAPPRRPETPEKPAIAETATKKRADSPRKRRDGVTLPFRKWPKGVPYPRRSLDSPHPGPNRVS